jgi:hypothetical protein
MLRDSIYRIKKIEMLFCFSCKLHIQITFTLSKELTMSDYFSSFNPTRDISEQASVAVSTIMNEFKEGKRSCILFAQMQSGKTTAFLFLAAEMLRTKVTNNVVIFTGNRERDLKNQLQRAIGSFFETKYSRYLDVFVGMNPFDVFETIQEIKASIMTVWGTELSKMHSIVPRHKTLYVMEEAHFAQSIGQCPDKFIKTIGLPVNGDNSVLEERDNYLCTVSATPFSELCDAGNFEQDKTVVRMAPGNGYRGVKWLKETGKIIGYSDWQSTLAEVLREKAFERKWGIIRIRGDSQIDKIQRMCSETGWSIKFYDQNASDIDSMVDLEVEPENPTLIILRERCRMGTVVSKNHLSFVFETSVVCRTDTLLQSLLGRVCGYHENDSVLVYIHEGLVESGEIETYIEFCDGEKESVPSNAKNVIKQRKLRIVAVEDQGEQHQRVTRPVIPIQIPKRCITVSFDERENVVLDIINALKTDETVIENNKNPSVILDHIINELEAGLDQPQKILRHKLSQKTFKNVPKLISDAVQYSVPANLGSGCGVTGEQTVILYYADKVSSGFQVGSYYICCYLDLNEDEVRQLSGVKKARLPDTTGKEVFRHPCFVNISETRSQEFVNGGFCISLKAETSTNEELMLQSIRECVLLSSQERYAVVIPKKITSIRQPGFETHTGIYVSDAVFSSLQKGGRIFNTIKTEFNVKLKTKNTRGKKGKMPPRCNQRIAEICW